MTFTNGSSIKFFYSAEGEKLKVEYTVGGTTTNTCYCANVVYENNNQKYLLNDEGYYDLASGARHYDPAIARWTTQDPLADMYYPHSPYSYCTNNPIKYVDENGEWIANVVGAVLGGAVEYAGQVVANKLSGKGWTESFTNVDVGDIVVATIEGGHLTPNVAPADEFVFDSTVGAVCQTVKTSKKVKVLQPGTVSKQKDKVLETKRANGEVFDPKLEEAQAKDKIQTAKEVNSTTSEHVNSLIGNEKQK